MAKKCCSDLLKNINVLDTIYWIHHAWCSVEISTICKCSDKCGFYEIRHSESVRNCNSESDGDDDEIPLAQLVKSGKKCMDRKSLNW